MPTFAGYEVYTPVNVFDLPIRSARPIVSLSDNANSYK